MADFKNIRRQRTLGMPPPPEEASLNLDAPEVAPFSPPVSTPIRRGEGVATGAHRSPDGRSLRRSGRTLQFATRVSPEFDARLRHIAERDNLLLVEIMEKALDLYEATLCRN
ncbi:hypothetical protein [Candidatus Binatus sp.]|jgi:hypothetical protein|uniref:hypothetical protein n=1 Tax=Candidatus Binatus sp. TaxID=2811406 RepID=UPI003C501D72